MFDLIFPQIKELAKANGCKTNDEFFVYTFTKNGKITMIAKTDLYNLAKKNKYSEIENIINILCDELFST